MDNLDRIYAAHLDDVSGCNDKAEPADLDDDAPIYSDEVRASINAEIAEHSA